MSTADVILVLGFLAVGGLFTWLAQETRLLPVSVAGTILFLVPLAMVISGGIGPGFDEEWVQLLSLALISLAFTPLLMQMRVEVHHEKRFGQDNYNWKSFEKRGWNPSRDQNQREAFKEGLRTISGRANARRRRKVRKPVDEEAAFK